MIYNAKNNIEAQSATKRLNWLIEKGKKFELTEKRGIRTLSQNRYLHLLIKWFSLETGYKPGEAKQMFKRLSEHDIYYEYQNKGETFKRGTSDANTKETAIAIERFRNYSNDEAGIYLPEANEKEWLEHIQKESSRYENRIYV